MRLSKEEIKFIQDAVKKADEDACVYLYGSRVHDDKKGGDIDLLILSQRLKQEDAHIIREELWEAIGEQRIDILIVKDKTHPFTRIALEEGVCL
ncbi:MAG: nucleotidyltransferase domain-containing protein [Epulopiscium sp.]|nr:nucleotidyltransferase domain-containing protein [Candidatus Epulonipiscium sp.]